MQALMKQTTFLADIDEPTIPAGLEDLLQNEDEEELSIGTDTAATPTERVHSNEHKEKPVIGTDKAATPAERVYSEEQWSRNPENARPLILPKHPAAGEMRATHVPGAVKLISPKGGYY